MALLTHQQQADAALAYWALVQLAADDGITSSEFLRLCMGTSAWESIGYGRSAVNRVDPGDFGSAGLWQLNSKAHPDLTWETATDPVASTRFWWRSQGAAGHWRTWAAAAVAARGVAAVLPEFSERVQVSDPWPSPAVNAAWALARADEAIAFAQATPQPVADDAPPAPPEPSARAQTFVAMAWHFRELAALADQLAAWE